jgi:predicted RNase H-like HicB family nuclease
MSDALTIEFNLAFGTRYDEEAGVWVGYCPLLKIYSQGLTDEEAEVATVDAVQMYIAACYERDLLHGKLVAAGMTKVNRTPSDAAPAPNRQFIAVSEFTRISHHKVPLQLIAAQAEEVVCQ